ncbi:hypothetical protein STCU_10033 [Strigomonas culicis]|uniref:Uncharacterized protein n=1 Tax=Strigomonas culicis TaxID=28005 RepID=S9TNQ5_9TRYP|nr:hypothetical protein STCU_10033 [Strigomonas culicis]|eukprot:EPY18344.1 hypothetical protein STCU_10033 [Strigomonas culicis]
MMDPSAQPSPAGSSAAPQLFMALLQPTAVGAFTGHIFSSAGDGPSREGNWNTSVHITEALLRLTVLAGRAAGPCPVRAPPDGWEKYVCRLFVFTYVGEPSLEAVRLGGFAKEPFMSLLNNSVNESILTGIVSDFLKPEPFTHSFSCVVNVSILEISACCFSEEKAFTHVFN